MNMKRISHIYRPFILFLVYFFINTDLYASTLAGKVLFAGKHAYASNGLTKAPLKRGDMFFVGDTISTGDNSKIQLKYTNGTLITLFSNTSYDVVTYEPSNKTLQSEAFLSEGKMHSTTKNQENAILKTPVVALAILRTTYTVNTTDKSTFASVSSGRVQTIGENPIKLGPGTTIRSKEFHKGDATAPAPVRQTPPQSAPSPIVTQDITLTQTINVTTLTPIENLPPVPFDPCGCPPNCPDFP